MSDDAAYWERLVLDLFDACTADEPNELIAARTAVFQFMAIAHSEGDA